MFADSATAYSIYIHKKQPTYNNRLYHTHFHTQLSPYTNITFECQNIIVGSILESNNCVLWCNLHYSHA